MTTITWDGGGDGWRWTNVYNWDLDRVPGPLDDVCIAGSGYDVDVLESTSIKSLQSSRNLKVSGVTLNVANTINVSGELIVSGATLTGTTLTSNGTLYLSGATIDTNVVNQGLMEVRGNANTISGTLTNELGATVDIAAAGPTSMKTAELIVAGNFTNFGTIELTRRDDGIIATLEVESGSLLNESTGVINVLEGAAGRAHNLAAELINDGVVNLDWYVSVDKAGADHVNTGTINAIRRTLEFENLNTFTNSGTVEVSAAGILKFLDGDYLQTAGSTNLAGGQFDVYETVAGMTPVIDLQGGILSGTGLVTGQLINGAEVVPGSPVGTLSLNGHYTQTADGTLSIEIGGLTAGTEHDRFDIWRTATFDGTLAVELIGGFAPEIGNVFQVIDYDSYSGEFATIGSGAGGAGCLGVEPIYNATNLTLEATSAGGHITDLGFAADPVLEGAAVTLDGAFTSPDVSAPTQVVVSWGDGSDDTVVDLAAGELAFSVPHTYDDGPNSYPVAVTILGHPCGPQSEDTSITINNVAPTATLSNNGPVFEGGTALVIVSDQFDPSTADVAAGFTYDYDLDADGTFEIVGSSSPSAAVPAALLADGPGSLTVAARIVDKDGGATDLSTTITINNVAPTATLSNNGPVFEGGTALVTVSDQFDPSTADVAAGFTYDYDLDADGTFEIVGSSSPSAAVPAALLADGPGSLTLAARIVDKDGGATDLTTSITINNVAPIVAAPAGPTEGVRGQTLSFDADYTDPGVLDTHTFLWQAVSASGEIVETGSDAAFSFTPATADTYTVSVTVTDNDEGSNTAGTDVTVDAVLLGLDPVDPTRTVLLVGSDTDDGKISVKKGAQPGTVAVTIDGTSMGEFDQIDRVVVYGQEGNDDIKVHKDAGVLSVELYGGPGNDKLRGGLGDDVLVGGPGDDLIHGHEGRDLMIGGDGRDKVIGNDDDDVLIGGTYVDQANRAALDAIMAEWTRQDLDYDGRVANLRDGGGLNAGFLLNDSTVFDDNLKDILKGNQGLDWFLADDDDDKTDVDPGEILTDIELEFILTL